MKKVGRYTSALVVLLTGALLLLDRTMETEYLHLANWLVACRAGCIWG